MASYEIEELRSRLPTGRCVLYAGPVTPARFIPCDGAAVSRSLYADLFAVIGTTYGAGDGSTTFNVPTLAAISGVPWLVAT